MYHNIKNLMPLYKPSGTLYTCHKGTSFEKDSAKVHGNLIETDARIKEYQMVFRVG
jgi:hypothetical protein